MKYDTIQVVIGSWGSYNECNERALGSKWIDLANYSDWDEIEEELKSQGFELEGIDEELFIQDIEGIYDKSTSWDYCNPKELFEILQNSDVLNDKYKFEKMQAYIEVRSFDDFISLVESKGCHWDDNINIYPNYDWEDYGIMMFESYEETISERLTDFFDFEAYGRYIGDQVEEYDGGLIEILY